jgi:hypothetical protein
MHMLLAFDLFVCYNMNVCKFSMRKSLHTNKCLICMRNNIFIDWRGRGGDIKGHSANPYSTFVFFI